MAVNLCVRKTGVGVVIVVVIIIMAVIESSDCSVILKTVDQKQEEDWHRARRT